jgi:hypothetical protein
MPTAVRSERHALLLASFDMDQVLAATGMLAEEISSHALQRLARLKVIETAIAVCYMRPLDGATGSLCVHQSEVPPEDPALLPMHETLKHMRHKVYVHTDRKVSAPNFIETNDPSEVVYEWSLWLGPEALDGVVALAMHQRDRFLEMAGRAST